MDCKHAQVKVAPVVEKHDYGETCIGFRATCEVCGVQARIAPTIDEASAAFFIAHPEMEEVLREQTPEPSHLQKERRNVQAGELPYDDTHGRSSDWK